MVIPKSGVYQIRNLTSGKLYIGSAIHLRKRWNVHKCELNQKQHHSIKLQRAWNKYGADAFVFEVILYCDFKNCLMYEQIALDHYKPEYNVAKVAGSCFGVRHTDDMRRKLREINLGKKLSSDTKKRISSSLKGHAVTLETKDRLRQKNLGKVMSNEAKLKMSEVRKGKPIKHQRTEETRRRLSKSNRGENGSNASITEKIAMAIKRSLQQGLTANEIATSLNTTPNIVYKIKYGKSWTHI